MVNIPPPTRANRAIELAPIPKVSMADIISVGSFKIALRIRNHTDISKSPSPTTVSPITVPLEKAILRPLLRLSLAPFAVLVLA